MKDLLRRVPFTWLSKKSISWKLTILRLPRYPLNSLCSISLEQWKENQRKGSCVINVLDKYKNLTASGLCFILKTGGEILKIVGDTEACYGCRTCELVCSFHHGGVFSPELSSIRVSRNNRTGEVGLFIDSTCDFCKGEAQPLCLEYCLYGALKKVKRK